MSTTALAPMPQPPRSAPRDLFVLRRVTGNQFRPFRRQRPRCRLGRADRGRRPDEEASLGEALTRRAAPSGSAHGGKELVFGPYYARAAAFVPVTNDVVVVFGAEDGALETASDDALASAATMAADAVESVTPAKRLADELEELEAVRSALMAVQGDDVASVMRSARADRGRVALVRGGRGLPGRGGEGRARRSRLGAERTGRAGRRRVGRRARRTGASRTASRMRASSRCRLRSTRSRAFAPTTCSSCTAWPRRGARGAHRRWPAWVHAALPAARAPPRRRGFGRSSELRSRGSGARQRPIGFIPSSGSSTPPDERQCERRGHERHHVEPHVARRDAARRVPVRDAEARQLVRPAPRADRRAVQLE